MSSAPPVGIERATPLRPDLKYGMHSCAFAAIIATLSLGLTKKFFPRIMLRSPSPSDAAPKSGALSPANITSTSSFAYVRFGSGWPPPKSSRTPQFTTLSGGAPRRSTKIFGAYAPVTACIASYFMWKSGRETNALSAGKSNTFCSSVT